MLEVIVNAQVLHQTADEVEIGFAVLDAVLQGSIGPGQAVLKISEAMILEDFFNNVGNRHLLKDAAIRRAGQEPQPGNQGGMILRVAILILGLDEAADVA